MDVWRSLGSDLRLAARRLLETPGFTVVCIATLAIGIGGNIAVFTLIDRVLLKPLPVPRPHELYRVGETDACCVNGGLMDSFSLFSYDLFTHLRDAAPEFRQLAAFQANTRAITLGRGDADTPPETLTSAFVSGNYFEMFGLAPAAGRLVQPADDRAGAAPAAVISHVAWHRRFGGRPGIVGAAVTLNGVPATIVGVAPKGFYGEMLRPDPPEIWVPLAAEPLLQPAARLLEARRSHWLYAIGRLDPRTPIEPLQARLTTALRTWIEANMNLSADERSRLPQQHIKVIPASGGVNNLRNAVRPALNVLQALAAAVLLIACANLASLLLTRGTARRAETAVRTALGASRTQLVSQFLVESLLLAILGGLVGLLVSIAGARAILDLAFRGAPGFPVDPWPSSGVVAWAVAASLVTGVLFGAGPAVVGSKSSPVDALRGAGRSSADRGGRLRHSLIVLQVALALVLVTCAGLLARSLQKLEAQDFGFVVDHHYVVNLAPSFTMVPAERLEATYARLRERLMQIPGVVNAAYSLYAPMSGDNWATLITVDGRSPAERLLASWNRVSPGYFETIGTPLIRGRAFDERDGPGAPLVAIVTQALATRYFGGSDPIGRRIGPRPTSGAPTRDYEIVGVVGDAKYQDGRGEPYVTYFLPFLQQIDAVRRANEARGVALDRSHYAQAIELRTAGAAPALEAEVRRALAEADRRITFRSLVSMDEQIARAFTLERLVARLTLAFGAIALLLACLGLYGVTAYSVARRTREIGIRMAVGASRPRVLLAILRGALMQLAIGAAIGLPAALAAGRLLQEQLFQITPHDPAVLAGGLALLGATALMAGWIPALRAATMDPVRALRTD
ncbi:MAG TPA: ABC transporter permease [Vicinamibacterales bacterium]|nr:ABC transporter permease [Vicinamibacterales bacterium]